MEQPISPERRRYQVAFFFAIVSVHGSPPLSLASMQCPWCQYMYSPHVPARAERAALAAGAAMTLATTAKPARTDVTETIRLSLRIVSPPLNDQGSHIELERHTFRFRLHTALQMDVTRP
jgi:hypothetical protein